MKRFVDLKFLFAYAWKVDKCQFFIIAARSIFSAFLPLINIAGLGMVIDALISGADFSQVTRLIIIYLSINLSIAIVSEVLSLLSNIVMRRVSNIMQYNYMYDCININYHFVQDGTVLNLKNKSMRAHPTVFLDDMGVFLNYIVKFTGILYVFSMLSPLFIIILLVTSALSISMTFRTRKHEFNIQNTRVEEDRKLDYIYNVMSDYKFAKEVRLNNARPYVECKYSGILKTQIEKLKVFYGKSMRIGILSTFITVMQTAAMYYYFSYQVFSRHISIAEYTVLLGATTLLASILLGFFDNLAKIATTCKYADLFRDYMDFIKRNSNIAESSRLKDKNIGFTNATIKFENVSFTYPNDRKAILKNINIEIKKGEKIGIVGLNGSGKTTLIKLLTRIYDPTGGRITVNGIDIREIPYKQYVSHIGVVLQDFMLFAYSIKENVIYDKAYDENKLISSIEKCGLENKIQNLKNGIETVIYKQLDDNGIEFSGGEGQKLALARSIYKDAEILILDEPTCTLDPIAEYELFSKLSDIAENKTTLFISHRLSSTRFCDRIFVLANGEIAECGSHNELITNKGIYSDLYSAQAKYYEDRGVEL